MSPVVPPPDDRPVPKPSKALYYSAKEIRELFGTDGKPLGLSTVYRWAENRTLPSIHMGGKLLFLRSGVDNILARHQKEARIGAL